MTPVEALQSALAGEHAAVYVYGVLGGRVSVSSSPDLAAALYSAYTTHRGRRDQLRSMVRAAGGEPVAAEVSYTLPNAARTPTQLTEAALQVEKRSSEVYAATVGSTSRASRRWAGEALFDTAVRALTFGGRPESFPGVPGL